MLEHVVEAVLEILIPVSELMGIFVVAVSVLAAFGRYVGSLVTRRQWDVKVRLAKGLALSLEFKMAAEILKTVRIRGIGELVTLGAVIVLRALLSALIHLEMGHGIGKGRGHSGSDGENADSRNCN